MSKLTNYGIIMELNPFHYGHLYLINQIKEKYHPDLITVIISGYFTMRGEISIMRKKDKVVELLNNGVDLVIELSINNTLNSANLFSENSIKLLEKAQITDLVFGVDNCELKDLEQIIKLEENKDFNEIFKTNLDKYYSYKKAYQETIYELSNNQFLSDLTLKPNNTLGIEYLKSLQNKKIIPHTILRKGAGEDDLDVDNSYPSGSAICYAFKENKDISNFIFYDSHKLMKYSNDSLNTLLKTIKIHDYDLNIGEGIENYIKNNIDLKLGYEENILNLSNKRYSKSRIKRTIIRMLLDLKPQNNDELRVLGFSNKGEELLKEIKKNTSIFSSIKDASIDYQTNELKANMLYNIITNSDDTISEYQYPLKHKE